ncbi:MarR family winged helix-turn-helix transcriptional regulator [Miniimonas arenae]|uniref:MarR family winged helix-turn-helix transcriptional regulator n=1 Tax=Miniimonas arenae TaxID=676201 RepID=UPI0028B0EFE1|nr:MarR family winged helix-turn-helix transcriptional regulator [Miniimonas arenae]
MSDALDDLAATLVVSASRFGRTASRATGTHRSLVAHRVLGNLHNEGPLRIGALTHLEGITQPAMTSAVNRLEEEGLVTRTADPEDARASVVVLTDAGRAEVADFRLRAAAHVRPLLDALGPDDVDVLRRAAALFQDMTDAMVPGVAHARAPVADSTRAASGRPTASTALT